MSIRDDFFTALSKGAKWDVGVSIARTNPLPLDANSVFKSEADLEAYCGGVLAYVGQPVAVVTETSTTLYVLDQNKVPQPVGTATEGDGKTIELTDDGILRIYGTGDAVEVGAQLVMGDGGKVKWVKPDTTTVEGLSSAVETLTQSVGGIDTRVTAAESDIDALEAKINGLGGIFNFAGSYTTDEVANLDKNKFQAGDVILVDGTKEYVLVEFKEIIPDPDGEEGDTKEVISKRWEVLGDPSGVTALEGRVDTLESWKTNTAEVKLGSLESSVTTMNGQITSLQNKDTELANAIAAKAAQSDLDNAVGRIGAHDTAISNLETKDGELESAIAARATTTYVDNQVSELNGKINSKADADVVSNLVDTAATKSELETGLNAKVNTSDYNNKISALESADSANSTAIGEVREIANKNKTDIAGINTALEGKASASDVSGLATRLGTAESTISEHTGSINGLTGSVSSLTTNKADKTAVDALTNRVKANEDAIGAHQSVYETLLARVNGHDTAIENAQNDATQALADAASAASAAATAQAKGEEALTKALEVLGSAEDAATVNTVYGAKAAAAAADAKAVAAQGEIDALEGVVNELDAAYKSADTALDNRVKSLENVIVGVQGAMHFVGISTIDPSTGVVAIEGKDDYVAADGDVVIYKDSENNTIEYIYSAGTWVELGDVSAESKRIGALETRMSAAEVETAKIADIQKDITSNTSAITALTARVAANEEYKTTNDAALSALEARVKANEDAIAKEISDRAKAISDEASARATAIAAEASARATAVSGLQDQINVVVEKLTWTKIGQ